MLIFWGLNFPLRMWMLVSFVSIHHCRRVCCTKAIRLWLNVFVIKHYWLPQSITLATVVPLSSSSLALQWKGGLGGHRRLFSPSFEQGSVVIPAVSRGRHVHMCVHSEMEGCYSVFKWSLSINFCQVFLTRRPLVIHCWSLSNFKLPFAAFASGAVRKIS